MSLSAPSEGTLYRRATVGEEGDRSSGREPTRLDQDAGEPPEDIDDPERLAREARELIAKQAADVRKQRVPVETEPPTTYRP